MRFRWEHGVLAVALALLGWAWGTGLTVAPREATMGETGRILYVHVPTAWNGLLVYFAAFVAAIGALWTGRKGWDAAVESAVEVGVLLNCLVLVQGSIWARPTWGIWWTWEPRLTSAAVMLVMFAVVLVLRQMVEAPEKRLATSAVATIIASVNVPIVYMSVKWWRTLHQPQSTPETVDSAMVLPLRVAAFGMLFLATAFVAARWRIARARLEAEDRGADVPALPPPIDLPTGGAA